MGFSIFLNILSILILIFTVILFAVSKRWSTREISKIDRKKKEVEDIIDSADQMIDELNRFSDYMLQCMQDKAKEAEAILEDLDNKINTRRALVGNQAEKDSSRTIIPFSNKNVSPNFGKVSSYTNMKVSSIPKVKSSDSTYYFSPKSRQIISLAEDGLGEAEIAKKLNIGRGEIQLVLGMKKIRA